ncbi:MAG: response regulator transcription factor [Desulfobacteraceae bacterium]|jgi:two-component system copper resistance phosphate regulon response regulator CusR|nr:response regulator transcription factor [Desulfobacteraceae bacterium]
MRILVVEDEKKIASFIERGLTEQHYIVDVAYDGNEGLYLAEINPYDLVVLDIMLPGKNGFAVCQELRRQKNDVPILMLTARDDVRDKIFGLDSGADDYLTKPFAFGEFLARIRVLLRRQRTSQSTTLKVADLELDQLTHEVTRDGKKIELTSTEYSLLEYLMIHAGQVVTRTMISEHVWDQDFDSYSNVINVYVNYVRKKVEAGFSSKLIHSVRGRGYMIKDEN